MATAGDLRGVVAAKSIAEGESVIEVPLAAALELSGPSDDSGDPSIPALALLRDHSSGDADAAPYYELLPPLGAADLATMPDFFNDEELEMTQCPPLIRKTKARQQLCDARAAEVGAPAEDVQWALCTVAQRSFTVLNPIRGLTRLLLPGIDLFNHDADSMHKFRVKWQLADGFDGVFKIVAGAAIKKGDEIRICYGGSPYRADGCGGDCAGDFALTNELYLQRYGFVDKSLGTTMVDGKWLASEEGAEVREALAQTAADADEALLQDSDGQSVAARTALDLRLHLKRALVAQQAADAAKKDSKNAAPAKMPAPAA